MMYCNLLPVTEKGPMERCHFLSLFSIPRDKSVAWLTNATYNMCIKRERRGRRKGIGRGKPEGEGERGEEERVRE